MSNEKTLLDLVTGGALPAEAQEEVWQTTCREILERHSEADLSRLLKVLCQLLPSLSVWRANEVTLVQTAGEPNELIAA